MRVPQFLRSGEVGFNMTPMIDVVFLLIIFFLVSSHLARQETQLELDLPLAESSADDTAADRERVTVNLLAEGEILLAGRRVSPPELEQRLTTRRERAADVELRIRADRATPYTYVEPVLLAAARAGIWNVTFAVYRREEG